jgi:hypothetical protein
LKITQCNEEQKREIYWPALLLEGFEFFQLFLLVQPLQIDFLIHKSEQEQCENNKNDDETKEARNESQSFCN